MDLKSYVVSLASKGKSCFTEQDALKETGLSRIALRSALRRLKKKQEIASPHLDQQDTRVSRAQFEKNLIEKASSPHFVDDIRSLLSPEIEPHWNLEEALDMVQNRLFPCLHGDAWKVTH